MMVNFTCSRAVLVLLAASGGLVAKPTPGARNPWWGPRTVIAGYNTWYYLPVQWQVPVTCDPDTSRCDTGDYMFKGGEAVFFATTGTAPQGIRTLYAGSWAPYAVCDVEGTKFVLHRSVRVTTA